MEREHGAQLRSEADDAFEQLVRLKIVEDGIACGGGNGMRLIGEAVLECAGTAGEGLRYSRGD